MGRLITALLLTAALTCPAAGADALTAENGDGGRAAAAAAPTVTVSGVHLMRNGQVWLPKGVSMVGSLTCDKAPDSYTHWGTAELTAAKSFGADVMRFQASQPYLDPQSSLYQPAYLDRIKSMVAAAQSSGFVVVLSMQDHGFLACGDDSTLVPTSATRRAWKRLATPFLTNAGVIFELFNEPSNADTAAGWKLWKSGGSGYVGHQRIVDDLRTMGAKNVLFVDGAKKAETLTGAPMLNDPLKKLAYAIHPYSMASINTDPKSWDKRWGFMTAKAPVVASEWNSQSMRAGCRTDDPVLAAKLVPWLKSHGIGLVGWSWDLPNTLIKDWTWALTTFTGYTCGVPGGGAGELLHASFTS
jgi:endoglucanase